LGGKEDIQKEQNTRTKHKHQHQKLSTKSEYRQDKRSKKLDSPVNDEDDKFLLAERQTSKVGFRVSVRVRVRAR
jgi:hypothetical protein